MTLTSIRRRRNIGEMSTPLASVAATMKESVSPSRCASSTTDSTMSPSASHASCQSFPSLLHTCTQSKHLFSPNALFVQDLTPVYCPVFVSCFFFLVFAATRTVLACWRTTVAWCRTSSCRLCRRSPSRSTVTVRRRVPSATWTIWWKV